MLHPGSPAIFSDGQDTQINVDGISDSIIAMMPDGVVVMDHSMTIRMCNPAMERIFGWSEQSLVGRKIDVLIPERYRPDHGGNVASFQSGPVSARTMGSRKAHTYGLRKDGSEIALGISIMKQQGPEGMLFFALIRDRSEWVRESEELERLANTDPLSGLPNRRAFTRAARLALVEGEGGGLPLSIIMLDIDHFKSINDAHGHDGGDRVIRMLPRLLKGTLRQSDLIARWGGEEFIVLLPNTGEAAASGIAERLRQTIEVTPLDLRNGSTISVTASLGVIACQSGHEILETIVQRADRALYAAKKAGRNRVSIYRGDQDWSI